MDSAYARWASRWRVPLGFLLGAAYLLFCRPTVKILIAGGAVAAAGMALRAFAAGHLAKNQRLAMSGPYAYTRNPLYLGSALVGAGFAVAGGWKQYRWTLALAFLILFAAIYWPVIRREEEYLRREFGEVYDRYAQRVPLFLPRFRRPAGGEKFQWKQYRKNHEYEAFLGYLAIVIFLVFKIWLR
ncbi:MAG: methyltransferase [Terriglobia bacterium]|jgi:protein-S-isoprenylcysteine O-methyltransferase Ste14